MKDANRGPWGASRPRRATRPDPRGRQVRLSQPRGGRARPDLQERAAQLLWPEGAPFPPCAPWLAGLLDRASVLRLVGGASVRQSRAGTGAIYSGRTYFHPEVISAESATFDALKQILVNAYIQVQSQQGEALTPDLVEEAERWAQEEMSQDFAEIQGVISELQSSADSVIAPGLYVRVEIDRNPPTFKWSWTHDWLQYTVGDEVRGEAFDYAGLPIENWEAIGFEAVFGAQAYTPATRTAYEMAGEDARGQGGRGQTGRDESDTGPSVGGAGGEEDRPFHAPPRPYESETDDAADLEDLDEYDICSWCPRMPNNLTGDEVGWRDDLMAMWALSFVYERLQSLYAPRVT